MSKSLYWHASQLLASKVLELTKSVALPPAPGHWQCSCLALRISYKRRSAGRGTGGAGGRAIRGGRRWRVGGSTCRQKSSGCFV